MVFESQPCYLHPIHHFLVGTDHLALPSVFHPFTENVVGIYVDADHDVLVTPLRRYQEGTHLVGVDRFHQLIYFDKDVVQISDGNELWR